MTSPSFQIVVPPPPTRRHRIITALCGFAYRGLLMLMGYILLACLIFESDSPGSDILLALVLALWITLSGEFENIYFRRRINTQHQKNGQVVLTRQQVSAVSEILYGEDYSQAWKDAMSLLEKTIPAPTDKETP